MLTVIMATHNGASTLPLVLQAYATLRVPQGGWHVVIADNGSLDATREIIHTFSKQLPLTYVYEPTVGKNHALNAALRAATGDLIIFTDDDAVPRPDWLQQLRIAADTHTEFHMFGGRVVPRWPMPPEPWILELVPLSVVYAITPGLPSGPVGLQWLFGPNMAVRQSIFDLGYRFDPTIGPRGTDYAQGGETEFARRLDRAGFRSWFCGEAEVEHLIRPEHLTEEWILGRARRYGRGRMRLHLLQLGGLVAPGLHLAASLAFLVLQALRTADARARRDRGRLFKARWAWNYLLGQAEEARRQSISKLRQRTHAQKRRMNLRDN
jgi:glycosyltransferase involved in cell wall biosynthesis